MADQDPNIVDVATAVLASYGTLQPTTMEDRDVNAQLVAHLSAWLESDSRQISAAATEVVARFVDTELDFASRSDEGSVPSRFGEKHRETLEKLPTSAIRDLHRLFARQVYCGYLFAEYLLECFMGRPMFRDPSSRDHDSLHRHWMASIVPNELALEFDGRMFTKANQKYYEVKCLWGNGTYKAIYAYFAELEVSTEGLDTRLEVSYFDAGIALRLIESDPLPVALPSGGESTKAKGDASLFLLETATTSRNPDQWPRLPTDLLAALPTDEQFLIRQHEEEMIAGSKMQLADICENCHSKSQFAKTYRTLRRDLRETLAKARLSLLDKGNPHSDTYGAAMIRSTDAIISHKLPLMSDRFRYRWAESIENWAGKEGSYLDKSGCCVILVLISSGIVCSVLLISLMST
jgi:hypothetical protein